jgi:hypothetical protein
MISLEALLQGRRRSFRPIGEWRNCPLVWNSAGGPIHRLGNGRGSGRPPGSCRADTGGFAGMGVSAEGGVVRALLLFAHVNAPTVTACSA